MPFWNRRRAVKQDSTVVDDIVQSRPFFRLGRRYLVDTPYTLPTDLEEINRLDFQHFMLRYMLKGNYATPLKQPLNILDVGCGTGRWAFEMIRTFPQASIIGIDIAPVLSQRQANIPEHFTFIEGNILEPLPFAEGNFDYVHQRLLVFAIPEQRWQPVVDELQRVTKPGGWIELVEAGKPFGSPALTKIGQWSQLLGERRGINTYITPQISSFLQQASLINIVKRQISLPLGERYGGSLGKMAQTDLTAIAYGLREPLLALGAVSEAEFMDTINAMPIEIHQQPCTFPFYIAYGQRA